MSKGEKFIGNMMFKFLMITLWTTSVCWASNYSYYNHRYQSDDWDTPGYRSYDQNKEARAAAELKAQEEKKVKQAQEAAKLLDKKIKILNQLKGGAERHQQICNNRQECLGLDQQLLQQLQKKYRDIYSLQDLFNDLSAKMQQAVAADIVVTEWDVFNSLSESAKQQYREGLRINLPNQSASKNFKSSQKGKELNKIAKFNLDDLKIYLLQQIEKNHQHCRGRDSCLQSDLKLVQNVEANLSANNPDRTAFDQLKDSFEDRAVKQPFEGLNFYNMYYDAYVIDQSTLLYKSKERIQWNELVKAMPQAHYRNAQITNQKEVKEKSKPENQMKEQLKAKGENLAQGLLDQVIGGSGDQNGAGNIFSGLFGN